MIARYTDGTIVQEGDLVRYHQRPGGLLAPAANPDGSIKWHEGIAATIPEHQERRDELLAGGLIDPDELHCKYFEPSAPWFGEYGHMAPHIIERLDPSP